MYVYVLYMYGTIFFHVCMYVYVHVYVWHYMCIKMAMGPETRVPAGFFPIRGRGWVSF